MKNFSSYMEMCMHLEGKNDVYLRIPTFWNDIEKCWVRFIKTPKSKKIIHSSGKDSFELKNNFNHVISAIFHENNDISQELFSMFKTKSELEEKP